ncbi:SMI1/KNR4 family protein [Actinomadura xylanilytica]|uniref:SMI1/KNR4 family protein n=1 Tax=Actinomadura xylanilytica TaxID=887459 RepID=UPI00255B12A7|nr:SMI1/KNR4 family protein [Actinomadura xylanilytica]MDL4773713.1 SMI1/KNR4 family protein [Actinomadura xylanilytica]
MAEKRETDMAGTMRDMAAQITEAGLLVLRPEVEPGRIGDEQEGPADPTPAGDPDEAVRLLWSNLRKYTEIVGVDDDLSPEQMVAPALDEDERAELLDGLQTALPPDLLALYGAADGDDDDSGVVFHGYQWLGLEGLVNASPPDREDGWTGVPLSAGPIEVGPPGRVRRSFDRPGWIPIGVNADGAYLYVDMDPGPAGRPGQVIDNDPEGTGPVYVADSVTTLLRRYADALDRGSYTLEGDCLYVDDVLPDGHALQESCIWDAADGGSLHDLPPEVQHLTHRDAEGIDLEPVRRAPSLRSVLLHGRGPLDLSPLRDAPVEELTVRWDGLDLEPLAGHPTLRTLLVGSERPVDVAVLRTFPRLQGLDLSEAVVHGLDAIAELDGLLLLTLTFEQWRRIGGIPPGLAAARLGGTRAPGQVNEWITRLKPGLQQGVHEHHCGRFDRRA